MVVFSFPFLNRLFRYFHSTCTVNTARVLLVSFTLLFHTCSSSSAQETVTGEDEFAKKYTALTKQALLAGIDLERFNLNYRLASTKQPKFRRLRYFATQETGAAGLLSFEIIGDDQFGRGRHNPQEVNPNALHGGIAAFTTTAIIAGAGSGLELGSNSLLAYTNSRSGFSPGAARRNITTRLKKLDQILDERDAFVSVNSNHPAYARAVIEGKILRELRKAQANEFAHFYSDAKGSSAAANLFYLLNTATNAIAATAGGCAYRGVDNPKFNGAASILFIVAGGLGSAAPWLASKAGSVSGKHAWNSFSKSMDEDLGFDSTELSAQRKLLKESLSQAEATLIPSLPAVERLSLYSESNERFKAQLETETRTIRHLDKVAVQQKFLAPAIDGTLLAQGIVNAVGFYGYPQAPKKQLALAYGGTIGGTSGAGLATVVTAAYLWASYSYEHRLIKQHRFPEQLLKERLAYLGEIEKVVLAL